MAVKTRKKKKFLIRFNLSISGILGLSIVCFCLFLWMFLMGIWAGQTILLSSTETDKLISLDNFPPFLSPLSKSHPSDEMTTNTGSQPIVHRAEPAPISPKAVTSLAEPSFFSLQVGAFINPKTAQKSVQNWRARGYDAFSQPPATDSFWRVFVGRFENLAAANKLAAILNKKENTKTYIALLPAS